MANELRKAIRVDGCKSKNNPEAGFASCIENQMVKYHRFCRGFRRRDQYAMKCGGGDWMMHTSKWTNEWNWKVCLLYQWDHKYKSIERWSVYQKMRKLCYWWWIHVWFLCRRRLSSFSLPCRFICLQIPPPWEHGFISIIYNFIYVGACWVDLDQQLCPFETQTKASLLSLSRHSQGNKRYEMTNPIR